MFIFVQFCHETLSVLNRDLSGDYLPGFLGDEGQREV